ncbi:chromosome associated protein H2 isoform X1 [Tachypleus tridentatus]|uniref:chromosome associated protein H2 isoform X1 n=1 Tax=Tachypleus tridentatus TaxID=6853 RepID=UPI003FD5F848
MAPVSSQETNICGDIEVRFAHLLNPIRDLTKNWEIDIAAYLEEYLAELEGLTLTFNDGITTLNFAQAALLIQGSTCVYSKKVEYLYNLVFQMLELLSSKKKLLHQGSVDEQGKDKDVTFGNQSSDVDFLSLDDLKEQKNLDLVEDISNGNKKKSGIKFLPRTPTSLIPLEESEKGNITLYNRKGEVLGNKHDFRVNMCNLHRSGALLLYSTSFTDDIDKQPTTVILHTSRSGLREESHNEEEDITEKKDACKELVTNEIAGCDFIPSPPPPSPPPPQTEISTPRRPRQRRTVIKPILIRLQPVEDLWKPLDPHEETPNLEKPMKRGKTSRIPKKVEQKKQDNKRKRKRDELKNQDATILPISQFCTEAYFPYASKFPKNPKKIPQSSVFYDHYWNEVKRKKEALKSKRKLFTDDQVEENMDKEDEDEADDNFSGNDERSVDWKCDSPAPLPELGDSPLPLEIGRDVCALVKRTDEICPIVSSYEELVQKHVENYLSSAAQFKQLTDLTRRVNQWEERIKPKLELEEKRGSYDIHLYGSHVMSAFPAEKKKSTILFSDFCQGKERWEICRYFLATLQLANNYNVEISSVGILEEGIDTMALTLLSRKQHYEELRDFRAPSVNSQDCSR